MKTSRIGSRLAALVSAMVLVGSTAWAGVSGTATAMSPHEITVAGAVYRIERTTSIETLAGEQIAPSEIRPGTPVELELDEQGFLTTIRATVVR